MAPVGGQEWQKVGQEGNADFMMAVAQAKQLVSTGKTDKAKKAFAKLKKDYPQLAGDDFDAFVKAELLFSQRKYDKASSAYDKFTEQFPESAFYQSAIERQYQIATAFLAGQKRTALKVFKLSAYEEGSEIMNKIADRAGDAPIAQNALKTLAQAEKKEVHTMRPTWHGRMFPTDGRPDKSAKMLCWEWQEVLRGTTGDRNLTQRCSKVQEATMPNIRKGIRMLLQRLK